MAPLLAHHPEDEHVVEAGEDVEYEEEDVQRQEGRARLLTLGTKLTLFAVTYTEGKEASDEAKEDVEGGSVIQLDHVHLDKRREEMESGPVPFDHVPDRRKAEGRLIDGRSFLRGLTFLARAILPNVSVHIDCPDGHNQVEDVDQERNQRHRDPPSSQDDE